jgi:polyisoprenoid-binding protein YceI
LIDMHSRKALILAALLMGLASSALGETWVLEASQSRLIARPTWEGQSFEIVFRRFSAELTLDPARPENARLRARVDVTSADADSEDLNEGMAQEEWLDLDDHRTAVFQSERIRSAGDGRYVAEGTLTLKGIEHALTLPFGWRPAPDGRRFEADVAVDRLDWRIGEGEWASGDGIGLEVQVVVDALFRPEGRAR